MLCYLYFIMFSPLLTWYQENGRDLPWRATQDPYKIWLSEVILQQTRVEQGQAYYQRFLQAFPTVAHLAAASEDEVLRLWQGLGYYSRARNLHEAAQRIVSMGGFPTSYSEIRALKGIGDYTAAAIASFAFGLPHAAVDGNVYRVLSRIFAIDTPIDSTLGKRQFAALAQEVLPPRAAALHNQAMMDLGATICTPRNPQCQACPLQHACIAHAENTTENYPVKSKRTQVCQRYFSYLLITDGKQLLLNRRQKGDIWEGLYEPLLIETEAPLALDALLAHPAASAYINSDTTLTPVVADLSHKLSHQHLHAWAYLITLTTPLNVLPESGDVKHSPLIVPLSELEAYAMPRLVTRILELAAIT